MEFRIPGAISPVMLHEHVSHADLHFGEDSGVNVADMVPCLYRFWRDMR
jgi:hypothetical protein